MPSLADMLRSQSNDSSKHMETNQQSLGDLLQTSLTLNKSDQSGLVGNTKTTSPNSLADLLATSSINNPTSRPRNSNDSSNIPSLTDLLKQNSLQEGVVKGKDTSLMSLLSPSGVGGGGGGGGAGGGSSIPSLSDILKNSPDRSVVKPTNKVPDLSTLLKQVNINTSARKDNTNSLIASIGNIRLSDLANQFVEKEPACSTSSGNDEIKFSKAKIKYMKNSSNFGKIFGAKFKKRDKPYKRLQEEFKNVDINIIFTKEMFGRMALKDVYKFNKPSPDDEVKNIQNKAFERK